VANIKGNAGSKDSSWVQFLTIAALLHALRLRSLRFDLPLTNEPISIQSMPHETEIERLSCLPQSSFAFVVARSVARAETVPGCRIAGE